jgi:competence protein ComEA
MKWKAELADYLNFSRKERIGVLVLTVLILIIFILPSVINSDNSSPQSTDTTWIAAAKSLEIKTENRGKGSFDDNRYSDTLSTGYVKFQHHSFEAASQPKLFDFDPNTLDENGWQQLGVPDKTVSTIRKYLSKGGHFYKPEDLGKIYGFRPGDYERLKPHIKIASAERQVKNDVPVLKKQEHSYANKPLDINTADTTQLIALPGIGSKLAARIVGFREKLGGFYSVEQIAEVYGLADSIFQKLKSRLQVNDAEVKKLNVNKATKDELKIHPYVRWNIANAIVEYRNQHGDFNNLDDLKKIPAINDNMYTKLLPYLSL